MNYSNIYSKNINNIRHVGYEAASEPYMFESGDISNYYHVYYSPENVKFIQDQVMMLTKGIHPSGRDIKVDEKVIVNVMTTVQANDHFPEKGDIYARYNIPSTCEEHYLTTWNKQAINVIVTTLKDEYITIKNNNSLSIWNTLYGDNNAVGLRAHPKIKVRERRPDPMLFHMRY